MAIFYALENIMYDYLIVGAGMFGSVFANLAHTKGKKCLVIDKRGHIGGNCYTYNVKGINVHAYGPHIFHTSDEEVWNYITRFAEFVEFINQPIAVYKGKAYNLPFNMNTFAQVFGVTKPDEARKIIQSDIEALGIDEPHNLEEQALSMVGSEIYERLVRGYTEKQWGRSCKDLPADIIKRLPLRFTYDNRYFTDKYQGVPKGGYTKMFEWLLDGIDVSLKTSFHDCGSAECGKVIYTGPIDEFFDYQLGTLQYRSLRFEHWIDHSTSNYQGNAVVNYTSKNVPYTRCIEHKHLESVDTPHTVITKEYPVEWKEGKEPYYPISDERNLSLYKAYSQLAREKAPNAIFCGRLGEYKYMDMGDTIKSAMNLAQKEFGNE